MVNEEVTRFRGLGRGNRILTLLIEGEPKKSFPISLREIRRTTTPEQLEEIQPLAADVRDIHKESVRSRKRMAKLRLLAPILGCRFDELRQREQERQTRRLAYIATAIFASFIGVSILAGWAIRQKNLAVSRELATKSGANLVTDPYLSVRLAQDAIKASQTFEAEQALRVSLKYLPSHVLHGHTGEGLPRGVQPGRQVGGDGQ